jgi:tetratricopeptide (TPR) repeat protein
MQNVKTRESMHEALFEFRKALEVLEPAYRKNPLHSRLAGQYGRTEGYLGHLYVLLLQPRSALEHLRRAVEVSEAVAAKDPKDVRNRKELADAHGRLGQALFEMHDADGAVEETRLALAAFGALPEASQSEVAVQYNRAITHHQLGLALDAQAASDSRRRRIDPPKSASPAACEEYRVAKGLLEENARRRPNSRLPRELMTSVDSSLGRCAAPGN